MLPLGGLVLLWLGTGIRRLDPSTEFGVVDGPVPGLFPVRTERPVVVAPPGLFRLSRYPTRAVEVPLPSAAEVRLPGADGGLHGLQGWATLVIRPDDWRRVHEAAGGRGLSGALAEGVRASEIPLQAPWLRARRLPLSIVERVRRSLSERLAANGIDLRSLNLQAFDSLTATAEQTPALRETRLLVVGLDGADWQIIDPLMEQGRMPNLERLVREGVRSKLLSISPMLSPVVWTTAATGVEPSRHGILDFLVPDPAGGRGEPVTSAHRRVPTLWQILSRAGVPVGVVGWWASWPAEPVNGYQVSDRVAYQLFGYTSDAAEEEGKVWPPELYPKVRSAIVSPEQIVWDEVVPYLGGSRRSPEAFDDDETELLDEFRTLLASGRTYLDVALTLREEKPPRFEVVYFEGTDTIGHLFMRFRPPRLPGVAAAAAETFGKMVDRYYETVDGYLGRLLEDRDLDRWTVLVLSDHGFVTDATRPRRTDSRIGHGAAADWHRRFGIIVLAGAGVRAGTRLDEASLYDVAPTILALFGQPVPRSWPGRVLAGALDPGFLDDHPVLYRVDDPPVEDLVAGAASAPADPAAADVLEKLESLGYVASSGTDAPTSLTSRNNAGVSFMAEGRYAEAEAEFRAALDEQGSHPSILVNLGLALRFQGRSEEAREYLEKALAYPAARRTAGNQLASICLEDGDLEGAEGHLRRVLRWEPDAAEARTTLGLVLEKNGDPEGAAQEYHRAVDLDPNAAVARNNLGNLAKRAGRLDEAEQWYREAIEADPYFMGAYNNLALVYQEQGEIREAIDLYSRARDKAPGNAVVLNNLASLHYATGDLDEARLLWRRAVQLDPTYASPLNNLAGLAIADERYDEAERLLAHALELDPGYGDARINLALVLRARGQWEEARGELMEAAEDSEARASALRQLGILELEAGRPEEALRWLLEANGLNARDILVLNGIGECYRRLGRPADAADAWRRSLDLEPAQQHIQQSLRLLEIDS